MSEDSTPPFRVNNETNIRMPLYLLMALLAMCGGAVFTWANISGQVADIPAMKLQLAAHDAALADIKVMKNDIRWIVRALSEPHPPTTTTTRTSVEREP